MASRKKRKITRKKAVKRAAPRRPKKLKARPAEQAAAAPADPFRDEKVLFRLLRLGDEIARDELVRKYSPWAVNIARKYHGIFPGIELSELVAEGNRGLLEALERFDPRRAVKFSTYAWFWIIKNIQEYINTSLSLIGVPGRIYAELRRVMGSINDEIKKGNDPSIPKISKKLHLDVNKVLEMLADNRNVSNPLSLDKYLDDEDHNQTVADTVEDRNLGAFHKILELVDDKASILELLAKLSPVEQEIIKWRFGFKDQQYHGLKEIGEKVNLSSSKVKDMESIAIIKLKRLLGMSDKFGIDTY